MTWSGEGFSPDDSQWVESHMAGATDVATLSGVPGALLNANQGGTSLTYQNLAEVWFQYWRQTLAPTYARRIESMWTDHLSSQVRFDPEELFLASMRDRTASAGELVRSGYDPAVSADVVGLPPIDHTGFLPISVQPQAGVD
jgi:phage portal protein BeeE